MPVRILQVLALLIATQGCSVFHTHLGSVPAPGTFPEGEVDYTRILKAYGPPTRIFGHPEGFYFAYESASISEQQFGLSLNALELEAVEFDYFKLIYARGNVKRNTLLIAFDNKGVSRAHVARKWEERLGSGKGLQLLFRAMPLVDDNHLINGMPQNYWGSRLLVDQNNARILNAEERLLLLGTPIPPQALRP